MFTWVFLETHIYTVFHIYVYTIVCSIYIIYTCVHTLFSCTYKYICFLAIYVTLRDRFIDVTAQTLVTCSPFRIQQNTIFSQVKTHVYTQNQWSKMCVSLCKIYIFVGQNTVECTSTHISTQNTYNMPSPSNILTHYIFLSPNTHLCP